MHTGACTASFNGAQWKSASAFPLGQTNPSTEGTSGVRDEKPDSTMETGAGPVLLESSETTLPRPDEDRVHVLRPVSHPTVAPNVGLPAALARGKRVAVLRFRKSLTLLDATLWPRIIEGVTAPKLAS